MSKAGIYPNSKATQSPTGESTRELHILLADDSAVNQRIGLSLLHNLGYLADAVSDGTEVFAALECIRYQIVLMDCEMPKLDGYETTRRIRELEQKQKAPFDDKAPIHIIAMTAHTMAGDRAKCLAAGMNDYVSKPVKRSELEAAFRAFQESDSHPMMNSNSYARSTESVADDEIIIDIKRLRDVTDDDPVRMRRLIDLYLTQTVALLEQLEAAVHTNSGASVASLAHKIIGSSVSCGVTAFTAPLRQLERLGHSGDLAAAENYLGEIRKKLPHIQTALAKLVKTQQPTLSRNVL